ncbi:MAG: helix-turn-helix transcriptional regulator [Syntrophomonadaceae bacterium]|nr:helix-turn-helix transcriptional regulator [Syntrophomonadaceae bacterium]
MSFKEIGSKIQQAREAKGLSQKQLARLVGCSQSALSNYEKGKRRLYLSQLEAIAEALNMPLDYFVEPKTSPYAAEVNNEDKEVLRLLNEIYTLTPDERQDVADFIMYIRWRRYKGGNQ